MMETLPELLAEKTELYIEEQKLKRALKKNREASAVVDLKILPFFQDNEIKSCPKGHMYRKEVNLIYSGKEVNQFDEEVES